MGKRNFAWIISRFWFQFCGLENSLFAVKHLEAILFRRENALGFDKNKN